MNEDRFAEYVEAGRAAFELADPRAIHAVAKAWITGGGGARALDPWLLYVATGILDRKPRVAIRSVDLALKHWIEPAADRAILSWVRGTVSMGHLGAPQAALPDFETAVRDAPEWLRVRAEASQQLAAASPVSRRKKPPATAAPAFAGAGDAEEVVAPSLGGHLPGEQPVFWDAVEMLLAAPA